MSKVLGRLARCEQVAAAANCFDALNTAMFVQLSAEIADMDVDGPVERA
jgi:hypothetical protein